MRVIGHGSFDKHQAQRNVMETMAPLSKVLLGVGTSKSTYGYQSLERDGD